MDKIEALFVRACKSSNSAARIKSVYRRFYYPEYKSEAVAYILIRIVSNYDLIRLHDLIHDLNPKDAWEFGCNEETPYYERVVAVMTSVIRLTNVDKFPDYPVPAMFRKLDKEN